MATDVVLSDGRKGVITTSADITGACPRCGARAIVELSPKQKAVQPDDTTHVCHPGFGGCNHGFVVDGGE